jgi:hypothetical protein
VGPRAAQPLFAGRLQRRRVGRDGLCVSISCRCGCSTRFSITAAIPSIANWLSASFLPDMNSTPPHMLAAMIGQCAGGTTLTALRLNERAALLSYGLTGLRAAPRSRCFPCLASLDPGGIWPAARLLYRLSTQSAWPYAGGNDSPAIRPGPEFKPGYAGAVLQTHPTGSSDRGGRECCNLRASVMFEVGQQANVHCRVHSSAGPVGQSGGV